MTVMRYVSAATVLAVAVTTAAIPASAQGITTAKPSLDEFSLSGSCIPAATISQTARAAVTMYKRGQPPAGVLINDNWVPAAVLASAPAKFAVGSTGCPDPTPVPTNALAAAIPRPTLPTAAAAVLAKPAPDQFSLSGSCIPSATISQTAHAAIALYKRGQPPAGVLIDNNWVPATVLASAPAKFAVGGTGCPDPTPAPVGLLAAATTAA